MAASTVPGAGLFTSGALSFLLRRPVGCGPSPFTKSVCMRQRVLFTSPGNIICRRLDITSLDGIISLDQYGAPPFSAIRGGNSVQVR